MRLMRDGRYGTHREKQTLTGVFEHHLTTSPVTKVRVVGRPRLRGLATSTRESREGVVNEVAMSIYEVRRHLPSAG